MWSSLLIQTFAIYPFTRTLLQRYQGLKGFIAAVVFLLSCSAASIWFETRNITNYYQTLGLSVDADAAQIKKAWKVHSQFWHPDKNAAANAEQMFVHITEAYKVLSDNELRDIYNRFGEEARERRTGQISGNIPHMQLLLGAGTFYVVWVVLSYFTTMGRGIDRGRTWTLTALALIAVIELNLKFGSLQVVVPFFSHWTSADIIDFLHRFYPGILSACRILAIVTWFDVEGYQIKLLRDLCDDNRRIIDLLMSLQYELKKSQDPTTAEPLPEEVRQRLVKAAEHLEPAAIKAGQRVKASKVIEENKNSGGIPSWVWMVGLYAAFYFMGGR
eukprot:gb/GEZN01007073.1/.p1 GENE.gb/GEZN01007073.1/~~gb/GEZN01007073.1/.p1  ORF type:complete len:330 (-),score=14.01 gb/GEZN01007073.1/:568-1557(-)